MVNQSSLLMCPGKYRIKSASIATDKLFEAYCPINNFSNSTRIRSTAIFSRLGPICFKAALVCGAISKPSCALNLNARIIRRASSLKRTSASPTARIRFCAISVNPSNKSMMSPSLVIAMALIVKSRLFKSSAKLRTKVTLSGRRKSV